MFILNNPINTSIFIINYCSVSIARFECPFFYLSSDYFVDQMGQFMFIRRSLIVFWYDSHFYYIYL